MIAEESVPTGRSDVCHFANHGFALGDKRETNKVGANHMKLRLRSSEWALSRWHGQCIFWLHSSR